ncbi:hypothetical protein BDV59DRAFT_169070 [Aspergillus ambiguus]|uniref:putative plasma membrane SNARE protein (Sec9) n=1 Tax=Aspergillus ambiguus TaxID=176160 RepID=UPI003CCDDA5B
MGRFGLKKSEDDDSPNRLALFGSRSKSKSPAPPSNPYAKPIPTDPYTRAKINAGVAPLPPNEHPGSMSGPPAPAGIPGDNKYQGGGYAPNNYGGQDGYGSDRFGGGSSAAAAPASRYGPGGYGGLGSVTNEPDDATRNALFGDARERAAEQQQNGPPPPYSAGGPATYGGGSNAYTTATYSERNLTAEEEEEEEIQTIKQDIRFIKQGDVASTRNALRVAAQAEETGRETLARLGAQGESIHDTEKSLDMATIEGRIAEEKAKELKTLNKSMFAVHVSNPFTSSRRRRERDEKMLNTHREERGLREGTQKEAFITNQRMERTFREIEREAKQDMPKHRTNITERAKYQFEADSEDEAMETEIDQNLHLLSGAAGRLNGLAKATGREIDEQNRHLERITGKSDYVDDQIAMNTFKINRIR